MFNSPKVLLPTALRLTKQKARLESVRVNAKRFEDVTDWKPSRNFAQGNRRFPLPSSGKNSTGVRNSKLKNLVLKANRLEISGMELGFVNGVCG
jgi:hypothetical protein